jgi:electron transport complex protein RnfC
MRHASAGFPKGGVHPADSKALSLQGEVIRVEAGKKAQVVVTQHLGKPSRLVVSKGQDVVVGQVLAEADGPISSCVHSPVSGKVLKVSDGPVAGASRVPIIEIMNDGKNTGAEAFTGTPRLIFGEGCRETFLRAIAKAGVVGLGGAAFPTSVKLTPPRDAKIDTLIINGCECEPYLTADDTLMRTKSSEVLAGAVIMASVLGVSRILVGVEDNKALAIEALGAAAKQQTWTSFVEGSAPSMDIHVVAVRTRYPQGAEKQLIDALVHRKVSAGKLPFSVGVVVQNVGTALAVFDAVALGRPLIDRVLTISGNAVERPGNFLVPLGVTVAEVVVQAGGIREGRLAAIIAGGPMMGKSLRHLDVPVVKGMSGVLLLDDTEVSAFQERECIRCGRCVQACPLQLVPCELAANAEFRLWDRGEPAMECVECGCCQYVCPSRRNLVQYHRLAKYHFRRLKR